VIVKQRRQQRDRLGRGYPFCDSFGNATVSGVKSKLQTIGSTIKFEGSMQSEKAWDSWDFTENYQTTDLAILQSLALRSRITRCFFSGKPSYGDSVYTLG